jgi:hypothetical protein
VIEMTASKRPTPEDRAEAIRMALSGIAAGDDPFDLARRLEALHPKNDTFPGEVLLDLAADALELAGASRADPVAYEGIRERHLPEVDFRTKAQHHKSHYALRAVAMIRAGIDPALLEEVVWWRTDDLWVWALYALIVYTRVAAERTGESVGAICQHLADRQGIALGPPS